MILDELAERRRGYWCILVHELECVLNEKGEVLAEVLLLHRFLESAVVRGALHDDGRRCFLRVARVLPERVLVEEKEFVRFRQALFVVPRTCKCDQRKNFHCHDVSPEGCAHATGTRGL